MAEVRQSGRYGHRDATMILIAFRHGLRAVELCVDVAPGRAGDGRLHVRRVKSGSSSVIPCGATRYAPYDAYNGKAGHPCTSSPRSAVGR